MLKNYIKIAFKVMMRRKYYTFLALVGISFTIMIVTMAASFIDQIVGSNSSQPNRSRTLMIKEVYMVAGDSWRFGPSASLDFVKRYISPLKTPEKVSFYKDGNYVSALNNVARSHRLKSTDENFWYVTNFKFIEGRPFGLNEVKNASRVAVITEELKQFCFGDRPAVGQSVWMFGNQFKVIGVVKGAPLLSDAASDAWIPYTADPFQAIKNSDNEWGPYRVLLLAKSTNDFKAIRKELNAQMKRVQPSDSDVDSIKVNALTALQQLAIKDRRDPDPGFGVLFGGLLTCLILFMLIPVISLVNLNISRMSERTGEIGVRKSFGASSRALIGQFIVENIILTFIGGMLGLGLCYIAADGLVYILNTFDPLYKMGYGQFIISWRVFAFCLFSCLFFGFLSGVYPAFRMSRLHPVDALKGDSI